MLPPSITDVFAESAYIYIAKILPHNSGSVTLLKFRSPKNTLFQLLNMEYELKRREEGRRGAEVFEMI